MKNVVKAVLLVFVFLGCSKDDDIKKEAEISFNPPEWLMGRWIIKNGGDLDWIFSNENILQNTLWGNHTDFRSKVESQLNWEEVNETQEDVKNERGTDTEYRLDIHHYSGHVLGYSTDTWWFTKISENEMKFSFAGSGRSDIYVRE